MLKKALSHKQTVTVSLAVLLVISFFAGAASFTFGQMSPFSTQPNGSATVIAALETSVESHGGWNSSLQTIYDGIALGKTTVSQLQKAVDAVNVSSTPSAETVFYWYFQLGKFGVPINVTTIKAALDAVSMLPDVGGLPYDDSSTGKASFLLYNRYDLYAYQWAAQLGYQTSKWNLTLAYQVFNDTVTAYGKPVLMVGYDKVGYGIGYGPRYYDEAAETIDMYLTFWLLGITDGLTQARYWWDWTNANLWDTTHYSGGAFYKYAVGWVAFECEAGSMDQLVWKLYNYDPSISDVNNVFVDMETRALHQNWSSPQWLDYVVVHAAGVGGSGGNSQERLENTIASWGSMIGLYGNMNSTMKSELQALLNGTAGSAPAWNLTLQSKLYNSITSMFRAHSDSSDSAEATANGAVLLMLLSTVPVTGSLAVPLGDCTYQDINNVIDGGVSSINVDDRTVRLSVAAPGTFLSMFGTNIFLYTLEIAGVWQLTFASDWNSITAQTYLSELLPSRIYLGNTNSTPIPPPGPVPTPTPTPSPTPSPSPTPTPAPTKTLSPTKSPVSTPSPSPTPTPQTKPSNPTQTPTATPQPKNYVLPVTVAFAGLFLAFSISVSAYLRRKQALNVGKPPQSG